MGERRERGDRGKKRALPAAGQGSAVGVQAGLCRCLPAAGPALAEPARLPAGRGSRGDGPGHAVRGRSDGRSGTPDRAAAAGWTAAARRAVTAGLEAGSPGKDTGRSGKAAVRGTGRQDGCEGEPARAGELEGRLGPAQRREGASGNSEQ